MAIPLSYNIRNLTVRKTTTIMTALGIGLTVAVLCAVLALGAGLQQAFSATGHPLHLLLMRKGADAELSSIIPRSAFDEVIKVRPGIARASGGEPMASLELVTVINLPSVDSPDGMNVTTRGLLPTGLELRDDARLSSGRWFQTGRREVVVGASIAKRYPDAQVGKTLKFGRGEWEVVGVFESAQTGRNSEIWADTNQMAADFGREEALSSVLLRARDEVARQALMNELLADQRLQLDVMSEQAYYAQSAGSGDVIRFLGTFVAIIMAIGSCFAAMNTMYAAVARRSREIGTLRVLGFSRASILFSFFLESIALSLLGGAVGLLLVAPLNNLTTAVGSFVTFSEVAFQLKVTPGVMFSGLAFAVIMGAIGGLLPARNAARKEILTALREI